MSTNPLIAAYRKPALYISLPSGGRFYNPKPTLSIDGELAIYPMTARDELITKTPDALYNGEATRALIKSCCPDIQDADQVPMSDLIVILLAIRTASYGNELDIDVKCPSCQSMNMLTVDSPTILASAKSVTAETSVELSQGFIVDIKPFNLHDRTLLQLQQVKQQRLIQSLMSQSNMEDAERNEIFGKTFVEIAELTVDLVANCVAGVTIPDSEVITDQDMIHEWLKSISREDYEKIRDRVEELGQSGINNNMKARCQECGHEWTTEVELDMSNFFAG